MSRIPVLSAPFFAAIALVAAGCGSTGGSASGSSDGASIAPAGAPVYVSVDTNRASGQWKAAAALLAKFPGKQALLDRIDTSFSKSTGGLTFGKDVLPYLGPELDLVVLDVADAGKNVVAMTQPTDAAKLDKALEAGTSPAVHTTVDGWTIFSDNQAALDRFKADAAKGKLADGQQYQDAVAKLSGDSLATLYLDGAAVKDYAQAHAGSIGGTGASAASDLRAVVAELVAGDTGVKLDGTALFSKEQTSFRSFTSALAGDVPSGALAYLSFDNLAATLGQLRGAAGAQKQTGALGALGPTLTTIGALLGGEGALYVRTGSPVPEVTLVLTEADPQQALAKLDELAHQLGALVGAKVDDTTAAGVPVKRFAIRGFPIYYGLLDGKLVVTDTSGGFQGLKSGGAKLVDDQIFKDAKQAAGMGDRTTGFVYVDFRDSLPLLENFASLAGTKLPANLDANLQPLESLLLFGSQQGKEASFTAYLSIR